MDELLEELRSAEVICESCPSFHDIGKDVCSGCSVNSRINDLENEIAAFGED